jgi:hypothetical protein
VTPQEARRLLGVTTDDDLDAVRSAFRAKAPEQHPDRGGDPADLRRLLEARLTLLGQPTSDPSSARGAASDGIRFVRRTWWQRLLHSVLDGLPDSWRPARRDLD